MTAEFKHVDTCECVQCRLNRAEARIGELDRWSRVHDHVIETPRWSGPQLAAWIALMVVAAAWLGSSL